MNTTVPSNSTEFEFKTSSESSEPNGTLSSFSMFSTNKVTSSDVSKRSLLLAAAAAPVQESEKSAEEKILKSA